MRERAFPYEEIEKKIDYTFQDKSLLKKAFTHSTYANAYGGEDNERMEYLGDAVLQMVVTEWQYAHKKSASEGTLTRERQLYVCEEALMDAVDELGIKKHLLFSGGSANVGRKTLSSLFETVIAAVYLDGGYDCAKKFVLKYGGLEKQTVSVNYKGIAQEFMQKHGEELPVYETQKSGKDNAPVFKTQVFAMGLTAEGEGGSKKEAEQSAAKALMERLSHK